MRAMLAFVLSVLMTPALAVDLESEFTNIDGGTHRLSDWQGKPVLVVNTASLCGFTHQYTELQNLHDAYSAEGLVVLAVPSDDFAQELSGDDQVREFCEVNYGLTLPMTGITKILGDKAHPFYKSLAVEKNFQPNWNFNKVLLDLNGNVVETFRATTPPMSRQITDPIEDLLSKIGS